MKASARLCTWFFCAVAACHAGDAASADKTSAQLTPVAIDVGNVPIPVQGSDGRYHVVYELALVNMSGDRIVIDRLNVIDARTGTRVATLTAAELGQRLVVRDKTATPGALGASQAGILYMHVIFDNMAAIPPALDHELAATAGSRKIAETAGHTRVARPTELVLDSPLRGSRFIAGDGCCDSTRHLRASLALNGRVFTAQRFAIDWEQLDEQGRIYVGDPKEPASYVIYGKPVYTVADARVVAAVDGISDWPPGTFPEGIAADEADGNHVVLDLGNRRYALYAHLKPQSLRVKKGDLVRRGQMLGEVGTSGNSSEPHLHFHVMDSPSPLASNGLPYRLRQFTSSRRGISTAAFDQAILDGQTTPTEPVSGPAQRTSVMPLDLWIVDFHR